MSSSNISHNVCIVACSALEVEKTKTRNSMHIYVSLYQVNISPFQDIQTL